MLIVVSILKTFSFQISVSVSELVIFVANISVIGVLENFQICAPLITDTHAFMYSIHGRVQMYIKIMEVWVSQHHPKTSFTLAILKLWQYNQAQKCCQYEPKCFQ